GFQSGPAHQQCGSIEVKVERTFGFFNHIDNLLSRRFSYVRQRSLGAFPPLLLSNPDAAKQPIHEIGDDTREEDHLFAALVLNQVSRQITIIANEIPKVSLSRFLLRRAKVL